MSEQRMAYTMPANDDDDAPVQFAERIADGVARVMGVMAEVHEYRGQSYWRAFQWCEEHGRQFVSYKTALGHLTPFRHAVISPLETVEWCYLRKDMPDGP